MEPEAPENSPDIYRKVLHSAFRIISRRDHSVSELKQKLSRRGFPGSSIGRVIDYLKGLGYLDDDSFARDMVKYLQREKRIGPARMEYELRKKGIGRELVGEAMGEYSDEMEDENLRSLIESRLRRGEPRDKTVRFLMGKGYRLEHIRHFLGRYEWTDENEREAE